MYRNGILDIIFGNWNILAISKPPEAKTLEIKALEMF
jgi:hypothetical protein